MKSFKGFFGWFSQVWTLFCVGTGIGFFSGACSTKPHGAEELEATNTYMTPKEEGNENKLPSTESPAPTNNTPESTSPQNDAPTDGNDSPALPPQAGANPNPTDPSEPSESTVPAESGTPEESFLRGLTSSTDPSARLFTAEEAANKAAEISNSGIEMGQFSAVHAFVSNLEGAPFKDKLAVDKAIEVAKGGFDLDKLRATSDFLGEMRNAEGQRLVPSATGLDHSMHLLQASHFDLDQLRADYNEALSQNPDSGAALQRALEKLGLPLN